MVRGQRRWLKLYIYSPRQVLTTLLISDCRFRISHSAFRNLKSEILNQRRNDHGKNDYMGNEDGCGFGPG